MLLDRIPDLVGLNASDWAGMQVSRLWAVPLIERERYSEEYRLIALESIERLDDYTWRLTPRTGMEISPRTILSSWRVNAMCRGNESFFFLHEARSDSEQALIVTTRQAYPDIRPFLDAFDLWLGLDRAAEEWSLRSNEPRSSTVHARGRRVRVQAIRGVEEAMEFEAANATAASVRCGLPGPFPVMTSPLRTTLAYVLIPRRPGLSTVEGDMRMFLQGIQACGSMERGFAVSARAGYFLREIDGDDAKRLRVGFTEYYPNADVAGCVADGIRSTMPGRQVDSRGRAYGESYLPHSEDDYNLRILVPMNGSPTGELRSIIRLAAPHLSACELAAVQSQIDVAEFVGGAEELSEARRMTLIATGVGLLGHYMCSSGERGGLEPLASRLGIIPLEDWSKHELQ